jgi:uncharacterized membrane protein YhfC
MQIDILFIAHTLNWLLMIGMPIALGIYLTRRFKLGWRLWFIGAAGFIISQVFHIPFNNFLTILFQNGSLPRPPIGYRLMTNAIILGLSAGLFEEITRYFVIRFWAKEARSWRKSILLGAGHGGAEAIIIGGLAFYSFIQLVAYRNVDLSQVVPADQLAQAQQSMSAYWTSTWYASLLGALERFFTIPVQICLAVIVMQVFTRKRFYWLGAAILWHAILDAAAVYANGSLSSYSWGIYAVEGIIGLTSVISVGIIYALRQPEPLEAEAISTAPIMPVTLTPIETKETPEKLDDSRFN